MEDFTYYTAEVCAKLGLLCGPCVAFQADQVRRLVTPYQTTDSIRSLFRIIYGSPECQKNENRFIKLVKAKEPTPVIVLDSKPTHPESIKALAKGAAA